MTPSQLTDWLAVAAWVRAHPRPAEIEAALTRIEDSIGPGDVRSPDADGSIWPLVEVK